ncbi:Riboflavin transporter [Carnobacterium maltaromaticum]|uniref:ECF transporter S component n=1 Tax=Carnobacterium maltaromaticum TaxID=2751 RepID=UPI00191BC72C|nr:ECF transporter S component [Carnobacterium maltaromaticum]CAD5902057.1 Riboflavin transporter [Carnobacterium maltaromaticum]
MKRKIKTRNITFIGILSALGYVFMLFSFPVLPMFSYLKIDFSDVAVIIGMYIISPMAGVCIALIKTVLHFLFTGGDIANLIGDITSFIASLSVTLPFYYFTKNKLSQRNILFGGLTSTLSLTVILALANYFVITPLYLSILNMDFGMPTLKLITISIIPFNLIKGLILSVVFLIILTKLVPTISRFSNKKYE